MKKTTYLTSILFFWICMNLSAQWTKTNGLPGGSVGGFLSYGDTLLVTAGDEIYYSSNHGQTWAPMPNSLGFSIYDGCSDGHDLVAYHWDPSINSRYTRTDDFGQHWHQIDYPDSISFYELRLINGYIYGSHYEGLMRTNDDGAHWEILTTEYRGELMSDGARITAVGMAGLVQSTDGGFTWNTILQYQGNVIGTLQHDNLIVLFMQSAQHGCYVSEDYGQTWSHHTGFGFDQVYDFVYHDGLLFGLDGDQLLRSTNKGATWTIQPLPQYLDYGAYSGISSGGALLISGFYNTPFGAIQRSTDNGHSWFAADFGLNSGGGRLRNLDGKLYACSSSGLYQLMDDGLNWDAKYQSFITSGNLYYAGVQDFVHAGDNLMICDGNKSWVSLDQGANWYESFIGGSQISSSYLYRFLVIGDKVIAEGDDFISYDDYISDNQGLTFQPFRTLIDQYSAYATTFCLDQGKLYALASDKNIYRSDDEGDTWVLVASQIPFSPNWLESTDNFFVLGSFMLYSPDSYLNKMWISKNSGQSWQEIDLKTTYLNLNGQPFQDIVQAGNILIGSNSSGVYYSTDQGDNWINWNQGLGTGYYNSINDLEIYQGYIWASGQGVWKRPLSELNMQSVSGIVYLDENENQIKDNSENGLGNWIVSSTLTGSCTTTRPDGSYDLLSNLPQESLQVNPNKPYWAVNPATTPTSVPQAGVDFAVHINPDARDLSVNLTRSGPLRPGFETQYILTYRNLVPLNADNLSITVQFPPDLLELVSTIPAPQSQNGNTLNWAPGSLSGFGQGIIALRFKVPVADTLGIQICLYADIAPTSDDFTPQNNVSASCAMVVGSYDPNDKTAEPKALSPTQLAERHPVTFTVRFQNTGNYPATFVHILDTLQQGFDPASFEMLASSHPCNWTMRGAGVVEFTLDNIQLPPSGSDEAGSHGFVQYSVKPLADIPLGTILRNTAHIFFDYNAPIITNTTETAAGLVKTKEPSNPETSLRISPNPTSGKTRVYTRESGRLALQDALGRMVLQTTVKGDQIELSLENLDQGVYQVIFIGASGLTRGALVVQR